MSTKFQLKITSVTTEPRTFGPDHLRVNVGGAKGANASFTVPMHQAKSFPIERGATVTIDLDPLPRKRNAKRKGGRR